MMINMKKSIAWIVLLAIIVFGGLFLTRGPVDQAAKDSGSVKPIRIGVIEPLSGGAASIGEPGKNGFSLAIEEINAAGGIAGRKVEVVYEDSKCSGKDALTAAQKLISADGVQYLVGALCSSEVLAALPLTEGKPMVFFGQGSSPEITGKGKYFFRTWPSDALVGKSLADFIVPKYKRIAVITEKTDYSLALEKTFIADAKALGGNIVADETFAGDTKDFRSYLSKIRLANPDVVFINPQTGQNASAIAKQARDLGIDAQFVVSYFTGDEFVKSGSFVNGTIIVDNPALDMARPIVAQYVEKYKAKFGSMNYPFVGAQMYDYLHLLKTAIEKAGDDPEKVRTYLKSMKGYEGLIGNFSFDQNGDVKGIGFSFKKIEGNALVDLK